MEQKKCRKCGNRKNITEFSWRSKEKGQIYATCKVCQAIEAKYNRARYGRHQNSHPNDHAHLPHELNESWDVLRGYQVMKMPLTKRG